MNNTPINLRIKFKKVGKLQYISHLDLVRTMNKIIVRAKLPLWYTEGFNPKPKMVFAAPLSTGTESVVEFMDLRLTEHVPEDEAMARLNANMTDEMQVICAYYPQSKLTDLKWLAYTITVNSPSNSKKMAELCDSLMKADRIEIVKKTKSGEALTDIRPMIRSAEVSFDEGRIVVRCVLSADSQSFLNPEYVIKYLRERAGLLSSENILSESYSIMRDGAYNINMEEFV